MIAEITSKWKLHNLWESRQDPIHDKEMYINVYHSTGQNFIEFANVMQKGGEKNWIVLHFPQFLCDLVIWTQSHDF